MNKYLIALLLLVASPLSARPFEDQVSSRPVLIHYVGGQGGRINIYFWVIMNLPYFY